MALNKSSVSARQIFANLGHLFALLFRPRIIFFPKKKVGYEYILHIENWIMLVYWTYMCKVSSGLLTNFCRLGTGNFMQHFE